MTTLYNVKFEDLFDSKQQAVTSYLSLERKYMELLQQYNALNQQFDEVAAQGYWQWQGEKEA